MVLRSGFAKKEDGGVKQIVLVGVKVGAVGRSVICFSGARVSRVGCSVSGGVGGCGAFCLQVNRLRLICLSLAICC